MQLREPYETGQTIQIKINSSEKDFLERLAKEKGLSLSELMRRGAWFYGSIDDRVFQYADELSKRLNIRDHVVISNTECSAVLPKMQQPLKCVPVTAFYMNFL